MCSAFSKLVQAFAAARSSGVPAVPMRASVRSIHSTVVPGDLGVQHGVRRAVELAVDQVAQAVDGLNFQSTSRPVTSGKSACIARREALGAGLDREPRARAVGRAPSVFADGDI